MFEPLGIGGDVGGKYLALVIGIIAVALFIFLRTGRCTTTTANLSARPGIGAPSLRVHPRDLSQPTIR
jgi:hypothetical protein